MDLGSIIYKEVVTEWSALQSSIVNMHGLLMRYNHTANVLL